MKTRVPYSKVESDRNEKGGYSNRTIMGKVSANRKELKPETVVILWRYVKITVKELCN
ncbi:TPA: hypothetical protein QCR36_005770 [Bacillus cereus]|nr:hypothetical protein [Bacillus cereus]HDR4738949.1 hypothetical protein [Bacillus cereus]HDR4744226.1 hypothetical protein [Bacillus cereus]HDR4747503.1 hypothetical protein [Bacillus cereus]HDR4751081.1 hypothetical protein [Bacillus cereus]